MLAFLIQIAALQGAALPDVPPAPDFVTAVDYAAWNEKQVKGNCRDEDNAGPLYRQILGEPPAPFVLGEFPLAGGPRWNVGRAQAWNPDEHADWEAAYQKRRPLMDLYREAARKPYMLFERGPVFDADGKLQPRCFMAPSFRYSWTGLACWASDHAWRARNGVPDVDVLIGLAGANLELSRQLARDASLLSLYSAFRVRWVAHEDLTLALKLGLLSEAHRARTLSTLQARDTTCPTLAAIARFDLEDHYDSLQLEAHEAAGSTPADIAAGRIRLPFPAQAKFLASREEARAFYSGLERLAFVPWTPRLSADIEELRRSCVRPGSLGHLSGKYSISDSLRIFVRSEAERRATRLIFEIHVFRDQTGNWPGSLSDLKSVREEFKTDPLFGQRFVYKLARESFELYSVSFDGRDNNGEHDSRWGQKIADSDYVFWPISD